MGFLWNPAHLTLPRLWFYCTLWFISGSLLPSSACLRRLPKCAFCLLCQLGQTVKWGEAFAWGLLQPKKPHGTFLGRLVSAQLLVLTKRAILEGNKLLTVGVITYCIANTFRLRLKLLMQKWNLCCYVKQYEMEWNDTPGRWNSVLLKAFSHLSVRLNTALRRHSLQMISFTYSHDIVGGERHRGRKGGRGVRRVCESWWLTCGKGGSDPSLDELVTSPRSVCQGPALSPVSGVGGLLTSVWMCVCHVRLGWNRSWNTHTHVMTLTRCHQACHQAQTESLAKHNLYLFGKDFSQFLSPPAAFSSSHSLLHIGWERPQLLSCNLGLEDYILCNYDREKHRRGLWELLDSTENEPCAVNFKYLCKCQ